MPQESGIQEVWVELPSEPLVRLGQGWVMGPGSPEMGLAQSLTLPQLQGGIHELHHVFHVEKHLCEVAAGEDIHEHRQEVVCPVGLPWERKEVEGGECEALLGSCSLPRARISGLLGGWAVVIPEEEASCFLLTLRTWGEPKISLVRRPATQPGFWKKEPRKVPSAGWARPAPSLFPALPLHPLQSRSGHISRTHPGAAVCLRWMSSGKAPCL